MVFKYKNIMGVKVYGFPKDIGRLPNPYEDDNYWDLERDFLNDVKYFCLGYNNLDSDSYIGEILKYEVNDGYSKYAILSLEPIQLLHLPLMDGYRYDDIELETVESIKEYIDYLRVINDSYEKNK